MDSLLTLPEDIRLPGIPEHFTPLLASDSGLLVERIVSWGHVTPEGQWCDQEKDEWVLLLEGSARLGFADGREVALERGRCLLLPRHVRHRVLETSKPCIWLAIHAPQLRPQETGARQAARRDRMGLDPVSLSATASASGKTRRLPGHAAPTHARSPVPDNVIRDGTACPLPAPRTS